MDILTTLQTLNACHGPAGDESQIAQTIQSLVAPYVDECRIDTLGNLIAHKKGTGPKIMFAAHMDSLGCIVTHAEKNGFLRFGRVGGLHANSILHSVVKFKNGVHGVVSLDASVSLKSMTLDDLYIDIGAKTAEEALKMVQLGDVAVTTAPSFAAGTRLVSPYMDNRISCVVLIYALSQLKSSDNDLYFVFTVQEELGLRGAKTAAYAIEPDYGIAVDVTLSDDELNAKHHGSSKFGGGAAVKIMDSSVICHPEMIAHMNQLATAHNIPVQADVIKGGGTDAGSIHMNKTGVITGGISIPCRYVHSPVEMVETSDVDACIKLVTAVSESKF